METKTWERKFGRRTLLKASVGMMAAFTAGNIFSGRSFAQQLPQRKIKKISWATCKNLTPAQMADFSEMTHKGYDYIVKQTALVKDENVRKMLTKGIKKPQPELLQLYMEEREQENIRQQLLDLSYIKPENTIRQIFPPNKGPETVVQDFFSAAGSGWKSHHAYPGGLVSHVATDLQIALGIANSYQDIYCYEINEELLRSAILWHDNQKPWVLQWQEDNRCLAEINIAGTGSHHILAIADAIYKDLSPELTIAIACSHNHPGFPGDEEQVVNWIKAAGIIAKGDPVKRGLLAKDEKTLPLPRREEGFLVHLGDHDYVLTAPVSKWLSEKLTDIGQRVYKMSDADLQGKPFNTLRNYLYSQYSDMRLYQIWVEQGEKALVKTITNIVTPD